MSTFSTLELPKSSEFGATHWKLNEQTRSLQLNHRFLRDQACAAQNPQLLPQYFETINNEPFFFFFFNFSPVQIETFANAHAEKITGPFRNRASAARTCSDADDTVNKSSIRT